LQARILKTESIPNIVRKIKPEITGEIANGKSINAVSIDLPGKSNLAMHHEAPIPKTKLIGTAMRAIIIDNLMASNASSCFIACQYTSNPSLRAIANKLKIGIIKQTIIIKYVKVTKYFFILSTS
jgi:hypothetical protein